MTTWVTAPGYCFQWRIKIVQLCYSRLGPEYKNPRGRRGIASKAPSRYGKWRINNGQLQFCYEQDLTWFLLVGNDLLTDLV